MTFDLIRDDMPPERRETWQKALTLPPTATIQWPVLPHNPYVKDGHAEASEGKIVITLPFDVQHPKHEVFIEIVGENAPSQSPDDR